MAAFENREKAEKMAAELGVKVYTFDEARVEIHMKVHG
jgi:nitrous oxide reductase accessory protein NosL